MTNLEEELSRGYGIAMGEEVSEDRTEMGTYDTLADAKRLARYLHELDGQARVVFNVESGKKQLLLKEKEDHEPPSFQVMPPLTDEEYEALKEDIRERGVVYPVIKDALGNIIDGHHRERAWKELSEEGAPITEEKLLPVQWYAAESVTDARDHAWRLNMLRRTMSIADKHDRVVEKLKESPEYSDRRIARLLGVSHPYVGKLRRALEETGNVASLEPGRGGRGQTTRTEVSTHAEKEEESTYEGVTRTARYQPRRNLEEHRALETQEEETDVVDEEIVEVEDEEDQEEETVEDEEMVFDHFSPEERALLDTFRSGEGIVVNMHENGPHKNLVSWLKATNQLTRADRRTEWGNQFVEGDDGDRETVVRKFEKYYLPNKTALLDRLQGMAGTAWGCWCAPQLCHCDILKAKAEGEETGEAEEEVVETETYEPSPDEVHRDAVELFATMEDAEKFGTEALENEKSRAILQISHLMSVEYERLYNQHFAGHYLVEFFEDISDGVLEAAIRYFDNTQFHLKELRGYCEQILEERREKAQGQTSILDSKAEGEASE
jgi:ParB-like chromosome segregation protein Spo0J